jgi:flagellar assembly protein FliH
MPVIKHQTSPMLLKEAIVLDLGDLSRQAARMRAAAEQQAASILEAAQQQCQQMIRESTAKGLAEGQAKGYAQGLKDGREQGKAQTIQEWTDKLEQMHQAWSDVAGQWDALRRQMESEARQTVLQLAVMIAERVVHRVVEVDDGVIVDQVAAALGHVLRPLDPTVRIHPDDRPALQEALPQLLAEFNQFQHVHLVDDDAVARGGCVVTYGQGAIDAQLDTQMQRILDLLIPDESGTLGLTSDETDDADEGKSGE